MGSGNRYPVRTNKHTSMSCKNAAIVGSIFLLLRLALCILFVVLSLSGTQFKFVAPQVLAILVGIGAFTDLILIFGAMKKNVGAIYTWCFAQIFVGGIPCCIAIPLVAMKAVQEIKDEKDGLPTTMNQTTLPQYPQIPQNSQYPQYPQYPQTPQYPQK